MTAPAHNLRVVAPSQRREWMTRQQVADHLQVSPKTIARWEQAGLPCHKRCNVVRYDRAEVDAWMDGGSFAA